VHGIYAADVRELSMRAAFPQMLDYEKAGGGSTIRGMVAAAFARRKDATKEEAYELGEVEALMKGVSVYSFKEGMGELVGALEKDLTRRENVRIVKGDGVASLARGENGHGFEIRAASGTTLKPSHFVSALPLPALNALIHASPSGLPALPHLIANPASSVTVVNLVFPGPPTSIHPPGFGYLVPRPVSDYADGAEGLGILGTVFDSCALPTQDASADVTKVTVMLGGPHYASGLAAPASHTKDEDAPDPAFVRRLLPELARHLGVRLPEPLLVRATTHEACIPTPTPGHVARMAEMRDAVRERWGEAAEVVGAGVGGVSVPACVEAGRMVGRGWGR